MTEKYLSGHWGSIGGDFAGHCRGLKVRGLPIPKAPIGRQGQGRAKNLASYTVHVIRVSDDKRVEKLIGPGYFSRKEWRRLREVAKNELIAQLEKRR